MVRPNQCEYSRVRAQWRSARAMRNAEPGDEGNPGGPQPDLGRAGRAGPVER